MSLLSERITSHLQKLVGQKLFDVSFFCFDYEIDSSAIEQLPFYFGGELILSFEKDIAIVTWDQKAGWKDHFSLYVGSERLYLPTSSLVKWNISELNPWRNCINKQLTLAQIYAQNETPHVVKFDFDNTVIFVGDSSQMSLGDGDDVLMTTELSANYYGDWKIVWEASTR